MEDATMDKRKHIALAIIEVMEDNGCDAYDAHEILDFTKHLLQMAVRIAAETDGELPKQQ